MLGKMNLKRGLLPLASRSYLMTASAVGVVLALATAPWI
jgi:hypothetical protein